jgi:hypothetical protein
MINKTELLTTWTRLKTKLSNLVYLKQHKTLIKEAVEFHRNQASSFERATERPLIGVDWIERELDPSDPTWPNHIKLEQRIKLNAYLSQKEKNKQIVKECNELLGKL